MTPVSIPQPLTGEEIKKGIAVRMTQNLPADVQEALREYIVVELGKTCSLRPNDAYSEFRASWKLRWKIMGTTVVAFWWVNYELGDYKRWTKGAIGVWTEERVDGWNFIEGIIDASEPSGSPPDRFRRETDQPIPKPTELKKPEAEKSTFSKSIRGSGKRRQV